MVSPLGSAVFTLTANTLGLQAGMKQGLMLAIQGTAGISRALLASNSRIAQGIGLIGVAATGASMAVVAFTAAMGGLVTVAARQTDALHNVEQTFGENTSKIEAAADRQARAFGRSRAEMLAYAEQVGRELQNLGITEKTSAEVAAQVMESVSRLAASRRISLAEAFHEVKGGGALYSDDRIMALAVEKKLIGNRNQMLDEGTKALLRYQLAVSEIEARTENLSAADASWSNQIAALQGNLANLAATIGSDLEPAFVTFLQNVNALIQGITSAYTTVRDALKLMAIHMQTGNLNEAAQQLQAENQNRGLDQAGITNRNEAAAAKARQERILGAVMGHGGGGGGTGFQGGLAGFARRVQESAFSQRQIVLQQKQLTEAEKQTQILINLQKGKNDIKADPGVPF